MDTRGHTQHQSHYSAAPLLRMVVVRQVVLLLYMLYVAGVCSKKSRCALTTDAPRSLACRLRAMSDLLNYNPLGGGALGKLSVAASP